MRGYDALGLPSDELSSADTECIDDDVQHETDRVAAIPPTAATGGGHNAPPVLLRGLGKRYPARGSSPSKLALEGLDLIVEFGECFGLVTVMCNAT